jgi:hypothetical protein
MRLPFVMLLTLICSALPVSLVAAETDATPIEQRVFDDLAARMQEQLHNTATILGKIRQSQNAKERDGLISEYHRAMKTTMKINHILHQLANDEGDGKPGGGKMKMKGKKMGAGMSCKMMGKKSPDAQATEDGAEHATASETTDEPEESAQGKEQDEHAGHH